MMPHQQQLQHEATWRLLLSELWQNPEHKVVCKLLCCSKAMEELVHSTCAGRLTLSLHGAQLRQNRHKSNDPAGGSNWPLELAVCRWLAKHARLCSGLQIVTVLQWQHEDDSYQPFLQEYVLAAGLAAAAGQQSLSDRPLTRRAAAAAAEATAIAAAREAAAAGPSGRLFEQQQQQRQGLPLQSLKAYLSSDGRLFCSLSGSTQLTRLELQLLKRAQPAVGCRQALASLTGLKELMLTVGYHIGQGRLGDASDSAVFTYLAPALRKLTALTSLHAPGFRLRPQQLPRSLLELRASRPSGADRINWQSLQGVTRLLLRNENFTDGNLEADDVLPLGLQELQLCLSNSQDGVPSLVPLLQLPQLTKLVLHMECDVFPAEVQLLQRMPQLKVLEVSCRQVTDESDMFQLEQVLSAEVLPLQKFSAHECGVPMGVTKPWKHLTSLCLSHVDLQVQQEVRQLAEQLRHLVALSTLHMYALVVPNAADGAEYGAAYDPLAKVIAELPNLRELLIDDMPLCEGAVRCLSAATQLRQLFLWDVPISDEVEAVLRAALEPHGATVEIQSAS